MWKHPSILRKIKNLGVTLSFPNTWEIEYITEDRRIALSASLTLGKFMEKNINFFKE